MNPNEPKKPSVPPRSNRSESDFFSKKGNEPRVPPGNPNSEERNAKRLDTLYGHGTPTQEQIIVYIILVIGLIAVFINPLVGGLIIGAVVGYHFSSDIIYFLRNVGKLFNNYDPLSYIIIAALLIGVFVVAPGFFIGAVIVALIKHILFYSNETA